MANLNEGSQNSNKFQKFQEPSNVDDTEDEEDEDYKEEDDDEDKKEEENDGQVPPPPRKHISRSTQLHENRSRLENLSGRMRKEKVPVRVHDVIIEGNAKTKSYLIESELEPLLHSISMQELLEASGIAILKLQQLEIFDSVRVILDSGPAELPGTANVIVEVDEIKSPLCGECGAYTKPAARFWTLEGSLKYKNWLGHGDLWDGSLAYGSNQTSVVSAGLYLPRLKGFISPVVARVFMLSQDWLEFSSYKERTLGLSLGLITTKHHDLAYNLGWRTLTDPSQMGSRSIRQLGHGLLSSLKYTYKIDKINSLVRPTRGYAFVSTSQVDGLVPDHRSLRQEFDLRYAMPFGFFNAALNFGMSGGGVFPWGSGFLNKPSSLPERFFLGGDFSQVCTLGGPTAVWGFKTRGIGPTEPRRQIKDKSNEDNSGSPRWDVVGGDLALTAFADFSFDPPIRRLREHGVHGHIFAGSGNVAKLTENELRNFSSRKFFESFRTSVGAGIIVPTKIFRLECNFYYILKQYEADRGKTGFRLSISAPS